MKIVYMGTPEFAVPTLKALLDAGHEIRLAVAQPDRPAGRGRKLLPVPVKLAAENFNIPVYQPESVNTEEALVTISQSGPDAIVVAAFGQILNEQLLEIPKLGCINLHASLLPSLRGAAPIQRAIMEGHSETGVTTMMMTKRMDAGGILLKETVHIGSETTFGELHDELAEKGAKLTVKTLELISKAEITPVSQDESLATYAPKITAEERTIDWENPIKVIDGKIRGLSPTPGAYTFFRGKRILLLRSRVVDETRLGGKPGMISEIKTKYLEVEARSGKLAILEVRPEGKKAMGAASWANGAKLKASSCFSIKGDER